MVTGQGSTAAVMSDGQVREVLAEALAQLALDDQRVLVIIPDATRTAPIPLMFRLIYDLVGARVARLDYLIALGTHQPMTEEAIAHLVGVSADERAAHYPKSAIYNHRWDLPETLRTIGVISEAETAQLADGLLAAETPVTLNSMIFDYDRVLICGPVFP
ncbi:MAG: lactate racemase domain-containing protein, partial [Caldilinea sp.]